MATRKLEYSFLLLGKGGSGRKSTADTLLGRDYFKNLFPHTTEHVILACQEFSDYVINVVYTPRIYRTDQIIEETLELIYEGKSFLVDGISAFLFVLRLGKKCTNEELETIKAFKNSLGASVFRDHFIIILTGGEFVFPELNNDNIQEWCRSAMNFHKGSVLQQIMIECDYRAVLFNNSDETKRDASVDKLLNYFHPQSPRFTNETFKKCVDARNEYVTRLGFPVQRSDIQRQLSLLENNCDAMLLHDYESYDTQIKDRVNKLMETVNNASAGSHEMDDLEFKANQIMVRIEKILENREARKKAMQDLIEDVRALKSAGISTTAFSVIVITCKAALLSCGVLPAAPIGTGALGVSTRIDRIFHIYGEKSTRGGTQS